MKSLPQISPSALQALLADLGRRAAELGRRQDALQDALAESGFPEVPYDHPSWNDPDTWAPCPAIPSGTAIVPPELDANDFDAAYPFLVS